MSEPAKSFWDLDFKTLIPVILFLVSQMIFGAAWISRLETRLAIREASGEQDTKRLERLELQADRLTRLEEAVRHVTLYLEKLDKKLDSIK